MRVPLVLSSSHILLQNLISPPCGQEGSTCLQVRKTIYCYTGGDRLGWSRAQQAGHGHAIGLATSTDGGVHFTHWANNSNAQCTGGREPFECCSGSGRGTCNAHHNPLIVANTSTPQSWNAGGGSCDITRKHGCVGSPYVIYDPEDSDPARRWKMWYAGSSNYGTTGMSKSVTQVAFASSPDGVAWTAANHGQPVFSMQGQAKTFPSGGNAYLVVKKYSGLYYMWFAPNGDKVSPAVSNRVAGSDDHALKTQQSHARLGACERRSGLLRRLARKARGLRTEETRSLAVLTPSAHIQHPITLSPSTCTANRQRARSA